MNEMNEMNKINEFNKMNKDLNYDELLQTNEELKICSILVLQIMNQQNELTSNTFILTKKY